MIKVIIIDDHKILVEGLSKLINDSGIAQVSRVGYSAQDCRNLLKWELPDVLMLDVELPDGNGVDLCAELKKTYPTLKVLALTSFGEYPVVRRMLESGAMGYILKNAMAEEIYEGIDTVAAGNTFLCHEVEIMLKRKNSDAVWLSPSEQRLLRLIVDGYTNPEIADKLCLSPKTIKGYRQNLLFKLGAKNTSILVGMAINQKLV
ncbi:MAG: response regulator transcription factor [Dysgonamonadaceae bacterium]|jgi:DNA-binding NarL/FixJ family response regulator|nr:response regulator transcription factor [Dysgonamonadaceae bacterium]